MQKIQNQKFRILQFFQFVKAIVGAKIQKFNDH